MSRLILSAWIIVALFILTSAFQHEVDYQTLFLAYSILFAGWVAGGDAE